MRVGPALYLVAAACGRIAFDRAAPIADPGIPDDGALGMDPGSGDTDADATLPMDAGGIISAPVIACGETVILPGSAITGSSFRALGTVSRIVAVWLGTDGVPRATTWDADRDGAVRLRQDAVALSTAPLTNLWAAVDGAFVGVVVQDASGVTAQFLASDLSPITGATLRDAVQLDGRAPVTRRHKGGFVTIEQSSGVLIEEIDLEGVHFSYDIPALMGHRFASIAAEGAGDGDGYVVVTEADDAFGPACWFTKLDDQFAVVGTPVSIESTQQADCDSSIAAPRLGPPGVGMAWMERDPANSTVALRGTGADTSNVVFAGGPGEVDVGSPIITSTSTGFAVAYRSADGLHVFDAAGSRRLAAVGFADLATWFDNAIAVWTTPAGEPRMTRLCP